MALIVQKYGGTSVGNPERIKNVAKRVAAYRAKGDQIVVVVSAMSGVTDGLIKLAKEIMPLPSEREMDMLLATGEQTTIALTAIALHALNVKAVSLTGSQAGIVTDDVHTKAKIQTIVPKQVHALVDAGHDVTVALLVANLEDVVAIAAHTDSGSDAVEGEVAELQRGIVANVRMSVDDAGDDGLSGEVDHLCVRRGLDLHRGAHSGDAAAGHDDSRVAKGRGAGTVNDSGMREGDGLGRCAQGSR